MLGTVEISWLFMFDGDNTLWDTNVVFTRAQLAVLEELRKSGLRVALKKGFKVLRQLDARLVAHYHRREYDFRSLFLALFLHFTGNSQKESVSKSVLLIKNGIPRPLKNIIDSCTSVFETEMREIPPLLPGVKETLSWIRTKQAVVFLFSDGNASRVFRLVRALSLKGYFDQIFVRKKTYALYVNARKCGFSKLGKKRALSKVMVVGDLLNPDIMVGNKLGAVTVLRLGGYMPNQHPRGRLEKPNYTIKHIPQLLSIIEEEERKLIGKVRSRLNAEGPIGIRESLESAIKEQADLMARIPLLERIWEALANDIKVATNVKETKRLKKDLERVTNEISSSRDLLNSADNLIDHYA